MTNENTCCLITGLSETGSHNPAGPVPQPCHMISSPWKEFRWSSSFGGLSSNRGNEKDTPQEMEMRRTIRFWWKVGVLHLRSNCEALLQRNSSRHSVSGWLQKRKEIWRIHHFQRIKGVLHLRRTREKGSRFSCWVVNYCQHSIANLRPQ